MDNHEAARMRWRCRRGLLELDLLLQKFFDRCYHQLSPDDRATFGRLLELPDQTLLEVLLKGADVPSDVGTGNIVNKIRQASES